MISIDSSCECTNSIYAIENSGYDVSDVMSAAFCHYRPAFNASSFRSKEKQKNRSENMPGRFSFAIVQVTPGIELSRHCPALPGVFRP